MLLKRLAHGCSSSQSSRLPLFRAQRDAHIRPERVKNRKTRSSARPEDGGNSRCINWEARYVSRLTGHSESYCLTWQVCHKSGEIKFRPTNPPARFSSRTI